MAIGVAEISPSSPEETNLVIVFHFVKFFVVLLIVGALVGTIYFNNRRRCSETEELLDELEQDEKSPTKDLPPSEPGDWEKHPDWWKNDQQSES